MWGLEEEEEGFGVVLKLLLVGDFGVFACRRRFGFLEVGLSPCLGAAEALFLFLVWLCWCCSFAAIASTFAKKETRKGQGFLGIDGYGNGYLIKPTQPDLTHENWVWEDTFFLDPLIFWCVFWGLGSCDSRPNTGPKINIYL